jgi:hypothetical protein
MYQSVIYAFMTGLAIGVSTVCAFQLGTAIAKYLARKDISRDADKVISWLRDRVKERGEG